MISVRLFATLASRSATGRKELEAEWRRGLTVRGIVEAEGLEPGDVHIAMVNGISTTMDSELADGDRVGLFPAVGGG